ncbi:MAG: hypothetical protein IJ109_01375 [Firmicutes bacterium]|nr:hypothetical protein [Bacillota bacterium]
MNHMNKKTTLLLLFALMLSISMILASCGSSGGDTAVLSDESAEVPDQISLMDDPDWTQPSDPKLASKAEKLNEEEENFYGTWISTSADTENLYGNLEITIKKNGTFTANITGEDYTGEWHKIDGGIAYSHELISGKIYYGPTCVMTFEEFSEEGEDTDDDIMVVLKKKD